MLAAEPLPPHYAESVMIGLVSPDGEKEISLRLARFPDTGTAHVWFHLAAAGRAFSVVDETFSTGASATPVTAAEANLSAEREQAAMTFTTSSRNTDHMSGHVSATFMVEETRFPDVSQGSIPVRLNLDFDAGSDGFKSGTGRWELTGRVHGSVNVDGTTLDFDDVGKWHEQTGPRARFAPAFTYLNLQNEAVSLLAIGFNKRANGYALIDGRAIGVSSMEIDGVGPDTRHFKVRLADGQTIEGDALVKQRWSVPIEGRARPGSTVVAQTSVGRLVGSLNDWDPGT